MTNPTCVNTILSLTPRPGGVTTFMLLELPGQVSNVITAWILSKSDSFLFSFNFILELLNLKFDQS